jgi:hypothetical protein
MLLLELDTILRALGARRCFVYHLLSLNLAVFEERASAFYAFHL